MGEHPTRDEIERRMAELRKQTARAIDDLQGEDEWDDVTEVTFGVRGTKRMALLATKTVAIIAALAGLVHATRLLVAHFLGH